MQMGPKMMEYGEIQNITPGLIEACKHFLVGLYSRGRISGTLQYP